MKAWSCPAEASAVHREICEPVGTRGRVREKRGVPGVPRPCHALAPPPQGITMKISGYDVQFPFKPYASQLVRAARYTPRPQHSWHPSSLSTLPSPADQTFLYRQGVMGKVLKAADAGENALLESPTGSGKSLALLCSGT